MALEAGTKLGPYEILWPIRTGGGIEQRLSELGFERNVFR